MRIIIETKLKQVPSRCTKCSYSYTAHDSRYCGAKCGKEVDKVFNKDKNNWEYMKPKWCPLQKVDANNESPISRGRCLID